jgi:hypothetical protein
MNKGSQRKKRAAAFAKSDGRSPNAAKVQALAQLPAIRVKESYEASSYQELVAAVKARILARSKSGACIDELGSG